MLFPENLRSRILAVTFPAAFILGTYGYCQYPFGEESVSISNAMYHSAQLFLMHAPHFGAPVSWSLEIARWMAATSTGLVLLNAALHIFHHEHMRFKLRNRKDHIIVSGLGHRGIAVVEKLLETTSEIVVIDKNPLPEMVERLSHLGIPLIIGDATRSEILVQARTGLASRLYALCPDDTTNISIALAAHNLRRSSGSIINCYIHVKNAEVRNALETNQQKGEAHKLHFMDAYGPEALSLLAHGLPLDHDGISPDDPRQTHLIILGFGCMGRTIAVKAAQLGHFANGKRIRISVIDRNADANQADLLFHHPFIGEVADFSFYQQEVLSPISRSLVENWCNEPGMLTNVVICFDDPSLAYDTAFNLLSVFRKNTVRVGVRMNETESFNFLMRGAGASQDKGFHIQPFGIEKGFENLIYPEKDETEKFAVAIHMAYTAVIREEMKNGSDELEKKEMSGELNEWDTLKEDFRESNRQQAVHMYFKIRACGFEIVEENDPRPALSEFAPDIFAALSRMEHERWVAERKVNNWKFGKPSDKPNRISENIVGWDQLNDSVKGYDEKTVAIIPVLLSRIGKKMVLKSDFLK